MRNLLFHPITVVVITIFAGLFFYSLRSTIQQASKPSETVNELKQEVADLASEVSELETDVAAAQTEFAQEKTIRDELLMQKPGEYVVQLGENVRVPEVIIASTPSPQPWDVWKKLLLE